MSCNTELRMKSNESLVFDCMITDGLETVLDLTNVTVTSDIRRMSGSLYKSLIVEVTEPLLGKFKCHLAEVGLNPNLYEIDMKFTDNASGVVMVTKTLRLLVERGITQ